MKEISLVGANASFSALVVLVLALVSESIRVTLISDGIRPITSFASALVGSE